MSDTQSDRLARLIGTVKKDGVAQVTLREGDLRILDSLNIEYVRANGKSIEQIPPAKVRFVARPLRSKGSGWTPIRKIKIVGGTEALMLGPEEQLAQLKDALKSFPGQPKSAKVKQPRASEKTSKKQKAKRQAVSQSQKATLSLRS